MVKLKLVIISCALMIFCNNLFAQNVVSEPSQLPTAPYRLFKTNNMWTFIKLDTATGKMWQLQFDVQGDNRGTVVLNSQDLTNAKETDPGRFTLYSTSNMYTFILVDQIDGRTWQVQWSTERGNRFVIPIY
jgi:hypothetical protein